MTIFRLKVYWKYSNRYHSISLLMYAFDIFFSCKSSKIRCELLLWRFDILQLRIYKTPDLESPKYQTLKKTANYEVNLLIHQHTVFCIDIIYIYLYSAILFCNKILHEFSYQKLIQKDYTRSFSHHFKTTSSQKQKDISYLSWYQIEFWLNSLCFLWCNRLDSMIHS